MKGKSLGRWTLMALLLACLFSYTSAQEKQAEVGDTQKADRQGRLPFYFGKIGVDDAQREKMYAIQKSYDEKIAPLREEIKKLLKERDQALEADLTEGQKLRLKELRAAAKAKEPKAARLNKAAE